MNKQVNHNDGHSPEQASSPQFIKDMPIRLSKNYQIKIATLTTIILFIIGATWTFSGIITSKIKQELNSTKEDLEELQTENNGLQKKHITLKEDFDSLKKQERIPILISPVAGEYIIGRHVVFKWKYDANNPTRNLLLELRHITPEKEQLFRRYQIPTPYKKKMDFQFPENISGEFFWRIGTGEIISKPKDDSDNTLKQLTDASLGKNTIPPVPRSVPMDTRLWSRYGNFRIYKNLFEKVTTTEELVVGMTNSFLSYDHVIDCNGRPNTYDMEFIEWVTDQLRKKLGDMIEDSVEIKLIRRTLEWSELFDSIASGKVDIAIANITKSAARERRYPGLKFSTGYRENHQRIIYAKAYENELSNIDSAKEMQEALRGQVIAVQEKSINRDAAHYLKHLENGASFPIKEIDDNYDSYVNVIEAVSNGKARFGMIDSVRLKTVHYPELGVINYDLTPLLQKFYRQHLGYEADDKKKTITEQYAIAVSTGGKESLFLKKLNEIIESDEGKKMRELLENKYRAENQKDKRRDFFQC